MASLQRTKEKQQDSVSSSISNTRANLLKIVMNNQRNLNIKNAKILVVGLTGAGKSTLLEFLKKGAVVEKNKKRTLSFNRYLIDFGKLQLVFIDAPGQKAYWNKWVNYLTEANGIVFLMDSANFRDVAIVNKLIYDTLRLDLEQVPTLFLANKQDLDNSINVDSINNLLKIHQRIPSAGFFPVSAINGEGILEAFKWFLQNLLMSN